MLGVLERAGGLLRDLRSADSPQAYADRVVDSLWDLIPIDEVTFNDIDVSAGRFVVLRTRSVLPPYPGSDSDVYDPDGDYPFCRGLRPGEPGVVRMSDVNSRAELDRSPSYQEMLRPYGCRFVVKVAFSSPPSIVRAVLLARADLDFTDPECDLLRLLAPHLEDGYRRARMAATVTPRELEVLTLVAEGLTNREVAGRLDISPGTVRSHLEHSYSKLGVGTRTAAVSAVR
jgi:DNA-binding CsgD family transcriptional regulator